MTRESSLRIVREDATADLEIRTSYAPETPLYDLMPEQDDTYSSVPTGSILIESTRNYGDKPYKSDSRLTPRPKSDEEGLKVKIQSLEADLQAFYGDDWKEFFTEGVEKIVMDDYTGQYKLSDSVPDAA